MWVLFVSFMVIIIHLLFFNVTNCLVKSNLSDLLPNALNLDADLPKLNFTPNFLNLFVRVCENKLYLAGCRMQAVPGRSAASYNFYSYLHLFLFIMYSGFLQTCFESTE